jgi:orotate phosphoribosyltransferase
MGKKELIEELKKIPEIIYRDSYGRDIPLTSGSVSDFYIDVKKACGYPSSLNAICDALYEILDKRTTCVVAGGYGGTPAVHLAGKYNLELTLFREKRKQHGKSSLIESWAGFVEGHVPTRDDKLSLIDDVWTTGGSVRGMIEVVKQSEAEIIGCYVVAKRGEGNLDDLGIPLKHLLETEDLL